MRVHQIEKNKLKALEETLPAQIVYFGFSLELTNVQQYFI